MLRLEQIAKGSTLNGIVPSAAVNVVDVEWIGDVVSLTYRTLNGKVATELKFRSDEPGLELVEAGTSWAFDSDGLRPAQYLVRAIWHEDLRRPLHAEAIGRIDDVLRPCH